MELEDKIECLENLISSAYTFEELLDALREYLRGKGLYCKYKMSNEQEITKTILEIRNKYREFEKKYGRDCCYGVYIIRCIEDNQYSILYIGKGGTIGSHSMYSIQGVCGRIPNVKNKKTASIQWFYNLLKSYKCISLEIEILCLDYYDNNQSTQGKPQLFAPGFIEALLLQYYLWKNNKLPSENNAL